MRVVIIGGGYAGLSCLLQLRRQQPGIELHLLDPNPCHVKNNHLHQTLDRPLQAYSVPFAALAERLGFSFHQCEGTWTPQQLLNWQQTRALPLASGPLSFDLLVLATGAQPVPLAAGDFCYGLAEFRQGLGPELMETFRERIGDRPAHCTVVGSGPSGIQFLFALHERLSHWRIVHRLQLVTLDRELVPELPKGFHQKLLAAMRARGISFIPASRFIGQQGRCLQLQPLDTHSLQTIESDLTLLFPGVEPRPARVKTNGFGQVLQDGVCLEHIFAAGDCADFSGQGLNSLTAQAAVRKGRLVAANILALAGEGKLSPYSYRELGFFLALGPLEGLGWLGWRRNLVGGLAAMAVKELLEAQYDLLLEGLDTYPG